MAAPVAKERSQPAGLLKLCLVEMWERFGFVTTMGMAVLFFASPIADNGLGWSNADALLWIGYFGALLLTLPVLGGWTADNVLGAKRAILVGGCMMATGYLSLGCLSYVYSFTGIDPTVLMGMFSDAGLVLARTTPDAAAWGKVATLITGHVGPAEAEGVIGAVRLAYGFQTIALFVSFLLIAAGNGLLKPTIAGVVSALYPPGDPRRDGGFTLFWTFINAGALLGYVVGGGVGEQVGWSIGYFAAFAGMAGGLIYFVIIQSQLPDPPRQPRALPGVENRARLTREERRRVSAVLLMTAFAIVFHVCHGQLHGLVGLFLLQDVDRMIGSFEVPVLWVTSLNPLVILALAPLVAMLWNYLGRRGRNPSYAVKFVLANLLLALSFFVLIGPSLQSADNGQASLALVSFAIIVMSIAEFPLQPIGLSMVTRLAPAQLIGAMVGLWLFGGAIANAIGGNVGALASTYGLPAVFAGMAIACALTGLALWLIRGMLSNWMALEEDRPAPAGADAELSAT